MAATVDLHLHTTASDGRLSPTELVRMLAGQGLKTVAISDHDTTDGLAEAYQAAREFPELRIIPGIELSADVLDDDAHILGYFLDYQDHSFQQVLSEFRWGRIGRGKAMVEKLAEYGLNVSWERVQEIAGDGSVGRPHIALALVEQGYFQEPKDAFEEYLGNNGLAYVDRQKKDARESIELISSVGGVAVLAHPTYLKNMEATVAELKELGLAGLEVHYAQYPPDTVLELAVLARRYGLIPTGGSDFHGLGNTGEALPGLVGPPMESVDLLEVAASKVARSH
jgi:predicted metal-dependent phosphoesterase TrpH